MSVKKFMMISLSALATATVGKEARREGIIANAEPGAIYLLHDFDGNEATVEALDEAIPALKEQGYVFVTVAQLFEKLQCTPDGHTMYSVVPDGRTARRKIGLDSK